MNHLTWVFLFRTYWSLRSFHLGFICFSSCFVMFQVSGKIQLTGKLLFHNFATLHSTGHLSKPQNCQRSVKTEKSVYQHMSFIQNFRCIQVFMYMYKKKTIVQVMYELYFVVQNKAEEGCRSVIVDCAVSPPTEVLF